MSKTYILSKAKPNTAYAIDESDCVEGVVVSEEVEITVTMKNTGDTVIFIGRFDRQQVRYVSSTGRDADFSYSDGANIEAVKPIRKRRSKVKTVIENTKPEL